MEGLREIEVQGSVQYIVVKFGDEQFGIDIKYIDNIVRMQRITRVPKVHNFIKGVINLRGEVIPVVSLRIKMELEDDEITKKTRIIIIRLENGEVIGMLVDEEKKLLPYRPIRLRRWHMIQKKTPKQTLSQVLVKTKAN